MPEYIKTKSGYCYKITKKSKTRISQNEYNKKKKGGMDHDIISKFESLSIHPSNKSYYKENDELCKKRCLSKTNKPISHPDYKSCYSRCINIINKSRDF